MRKAPIFCTLLFILLVSSQLSKAQIGGISGSKISSFCVETVGKKHLEMEPSFSWQRSRFQWNDSWSREMIFSSPDSMAVSSGMRLRFTYGVLEKLEAGVVYPLDGSVAGWGFRYVLRETSKTGVAIMGGLNTPFGNGIRNTAERNPLNTIQACAGIAVSRSFSPRFSVDMNAQSGTLLHKADMGPSGFYQVGADAGYYFFGNTLQLISGFSWQSSFSGDPVQSVLTFYPGITIETGRNFIIVIHNSLDLLGRNVPRQSVLDVSFTLTID